MNKDSLPILSLLILCVLGVCAQDKEESDLERKTTIFSDNGNFWDVFDSLDVNDNGGIEGGGQDAFDSWGRLRIRVRDEVGNVLTGNQALGNFDLTYTGWRRWQTLNPQTASGVQVSRSLYAPDGTDYIRYIDTFTNASGAVRMVSAAWGGALGSDADTTLAATSSGDLVIDNEDHWVVTIENVGFNAGGPATDPPIAYAVGTASSSRSGTGDFDTNPFTTPWPGNGDDTISFIYDFTLQPGQAVSLAYFLYHGIEELAVGPKGQPAPASGSEIARAKSVGAALSSDPDFADLTRPEREMILNWDLSGDPSPGRLFAIASKVVVTLTWQDNCSNETGFEIQRSEVGSGIGFVQVGIVGENATTFKDRGERGKTYVYRVRAFSTTSVTGYSNEATVSIGSKDRDRKCGATGLEFVLFLLLLIAGRHIRRSLLLSRR